MRRVLKTAGPTQRGGIRLNVALGQGEVEVLFVDIAAFLADAKEALVEVEVGAGVAYAAGAAELVGEGIQHGVILGDDGVEVGGGVEQALDQQIALFVEGFKLLAAQASHAVPPASTRPEAALL